MKIINTKLQGLFIVKQKNNSDNIDLEFDKCRDDIKKFALDFKKKYFKPS